MVSVCPSVCLLITASIKMHCCSVSAKVESRAEAVGCEVAASFSKPGEAAEGAEQLPGFWDWTQNMPKFFREMQKGCPEPSAAGGSPLSFHKESKNGIC